ncbi:DUF4270 family protein [Ferruginibacter paludis]|uniref:DUF4270 family protein n=1 Tax=Ferruginibacter paludis TaxID=1310417 RepID=UPI0025B32A2E|nr:DUF4270 family protein [Ferruginibacter paludis]MDN3657989.1 DUF4270 family protein [Ferruginibacter paludis]
MKQRPRYFTIFLLPACLLFTGFIISSCEKQDITFGSGFIDNTITNLVLVDTVTVNVSTVYVDSFVTSGTKAILAGKYKDEKFGTIASQSFVQLGLPSNTTYDIPNGSVFDSLEVILKLNKSFYGDTLVPYHLDVHQLTQQISFSAAQYSFYNNNSWPYSNNVLGSSEIVIAPSTRDTLAIKLSPSLGQDLFNKLQNKTTEVQTVDQFVNYFRGLAFVGGSNNNCIVGFKDSLTMRLHYKKPGVFAENATIDFGVNQTNFQFNNITADRSGTAISTLGPSNKQLVSSATGNAGYSQYISGAVARISFPYIKDLYQLPDFLKIVKAELQVKPVQNSFLGYYSLPPSLRLSATDQTNQLGIDLTTVVGSSAVVQYGSLYIDNLYGTSTAYTYDVTSYLQAQLPNTEGSKNGLLVLPPNATVIFNRLLIANAANGANKTQVKIYYAAVK